MLSKYSGISTAILNKIPSAGFWKGQSDEVDFGMSYEQLDTLLFELEKKQKQKQKKKKKQKKLKIKDTEEILAKAHLSFAQYDSVCRRLKSAKHKQKMPKMPKV